MDSPEDVLDFLHTRVSGTTRVADVGALLKPLALDSGWVHLGGSGARQQFFRLPDHLGAVFRFGPDDRLVAYGAYRSTEPWPKDAAGRTIPPASLGQVPLVLLIPLQD